MPIQPGTLQASTTDADAQILAALDDLQKDKISSKTRLGTLVLSLLAFLISIWLVGFSTIDILTVVVVIFIHEAGHYYSSSPQTPRASTYSL